MHIFTTFRIFKKLLDKGRSKKGKDISQDLNAAVIKMSQMGAREGGFHFFCRRFNFVVRDELYKEIKQISGGWYIVYLGI